MTGATEAAAASAAAVDALAARVDELARRIEALGVSSPATAERAAGERPAAEPTPEPAAAVPPRRRGGRPPKARPVAKTATPAAARVPLHEEIIEVIRERGPLTAAQVASAIVERGRYTAPRSSRPLDAAVVNSRVSNPAYRSRFRRSEGRIDLAP